jgi:hypothetical protein
MFLSKFPQLVMNSVLLLLSKGTRLTDYGMDNCGSVRSKVMKGIFIFATASYPMEPEAPSLG